MFIHDIIKIKYIEEGYLPDTPYKMISDIQMFDAFLRKDGYFAANYPCLADDLLPYYEELIIGIEAAINGYLDNNAVIPYWVYSYMLGAVISNQSDDIDIVDLNTLLNLDVPDPAIFTPETSEACYKVSCEWLKKLHSNRVTRPASMFGEPHVIKSLRLAVIDTISSDELEQMASRRGASNAIP